MHLIFILRLECGIISERGENEIAIISMIKDFRPLLICLERSECESDSKLSKQEI